MITVTYQRQKRSAGATGEPASEKKTVTRKKGVTVGKALVLCVKHAAKACGVGERTVRKWILDGQIDYKLGQDGYKKVILSQLKKRIDPDEYTRIKSALEADEPVYPAKPAKPAKRPVKKAPAKCSCAKKKR